MPGYDIGSLAAWTPVLYTLFHYSVRDLLIASTVTVISS